MLLETHGPRVHRRHAPRLGLLSLALLVALAPHVAPRAQTQGLSDLDRARAHQMLELIRSDLRKHYFDAGYRGIDLDAWFKEADSKLDASTSLGQAWGVIAQALTQFNDSHTSFIPPARSARVEYGWQMKLVGDRCYISAVKPGSEAAKRGLAVGDEVVGLDGYAPTRENLWKLKYMYYRLRPRAGARLLLRKPDGKEQQLDVPAKVQETRQIVNPADTIEYWQLVRDEQDESRLHRNRFYEAGPDLIVWKMPSFNQLEGDVDSAMAKVRGYKSLVLDLRDNRGGYVDTLEHMVGYFFDRDVKVADFKGRRETKPLVAKTRGEKAYRGRVLVLVDSESASGAEIFARLMQIEKRGTVIGDRTAGAVMRSRYHSHTSGINVVAYWGVTVTDADVVMTDGKSLEHVGVTPDEVGVPTPAEMAAGRDPVLARAAALAGVRLDPEKAGALFPLEWRK